MMFWNLTIKTLAQVAKRKNFISVKNPHFLKKCKEMSTMTEVSTVSLKRVKGVPYTVEFDGKSFVDVPLNPDNVVYCGRAINRGGWNLKESIWSNRIPRGLEMTLENYSMVLEGRGVIEDDLRKLRGKKLACWCYGKKTKDPTECHTWLLKQLVEAVED
jgi:hypothetical protein